MVTDSITTASTGRSIAPVGEVADQAGRDVVDLIATSPTASGDRPVEPIVIESVEVVRS